MQLEQTVTKLQTALGFTPEQVAALPPPLVKIRELEQENSRLQRENEELRRLLDESDNRGHRNTLPNFHDPRGCDRDIKRRKVGEDVYMVGHLHYALSRFFVDLSTRARAILLLMQTTYTLGHLPRWLSHHQQRLIHLLIIITSIHTMALTKRTATPLRRCLRCPRPPSKCRVQRPLQVRQLLVLHSRRVLFHFSSAVASSGNFWILVTVSCVPPTSSL